MRVQWFRREVPERGAFIQRAALVHPGFAVSVFWLQGISQDWGAQEEVVSFLEQLQRSQLTLLLAGRGYYRSPRGPILLRPGDVVEADQAVGAIEGYRGSLREPAIVVIVEWEGGELFHSTFQGHWGISRIAARDIARLRGHVGMLKQSPAEAWVLGLFEQLRSLGLGLERSHRLPPLTPSTHQDDQLFTAMGQVLSSFQEYPALTDVAHTLGVTERQARRRFLRFCRDYDQPYDGFRQFLGDARMGWVTQLLSVSDLPLSRVAELAGFRSTVALSHALRQRGANTPKRLASSLAERWG